MFVSVGHSKKRGTRKLSKIRVWNLIYAPSVQDIRQRVHATSTSIQATSKMCSPARFRG
ncbi:hypothetical protein M378DRAFT_167354 [Amanita muscaria Koide BX008]|uniref:Uncharacterized protein n=1 Tax=Amanita muscaria (strain Koide BX008) TaxID=946122 RepID=A0A0C2T3T3_AMAMK|nr:hypothetical protein M378DRAFT_167354 [Amanita muscaria Koide BX008]